MCSNQWHSNGLSCFLLHVLSFCVAICKLSICDTVVLKNTWSPCTYRNCVLHMFLKHECAWWNQWFSFFFFFFYKPPNHFRMNWYIIAWVSTAFTERAHKYTRIYVDGFCWFCHFRGSLKKRKKTSLQQACATMWLLLKLDSRLCSLRCVCMQLRNLNVGFWKVKWGLVFVFIHVSAFGESSGRKSFFPLSIWFCFSVWK